MSVLLGGLQSGPRSEAALALLRSPGARGDKDRGCCREHLPYHGAGRRVLGMLALPG